MISIAILCGGKSKRFGSDKTFYVVGGKTILEMVYEKFRDESDDIFLQTSNNHDELIRMFGRNVEIHHDLMPEKGPLGGIYSALARAKHDKVFIVAGDLPAVDKNILFELKKFNGAQLVVPQWESGFVEPLCAVYSIRLKPIIQHQIENNDLKINHLFKKVEENGDENLKVEYINIDNYIKNGKINPHCFKNVNCLEDLED